MTPKQRVARAVSVGPQPGTMPRTEVKLEETSPSGAWTEGREVAPERIERLARAMIARGAPAATAHHAALCVAYDAVKYVSAFAAWHEESDAAASASINAVAQRARALYEALRELGPRAKSAMHKSVQEDGFNFRFLLERERLGQFSLAMQSAARKMARPARRPVNGPARSFLRGSIHTWRVVVGAMPSPPNKRDLDLRKHALHNILREMVEDAARDHPLGGHMLSQISVKAFEAAHKIVGREFDGGKQVAR